MALTTFNTSDRILAMLQDSWSASLNPVLASPIVQGLQLSNIKVVSGVNTINTTLGRKLRGWIIVGQSASAAFYDSQASNQMPDKTLILNASAPCTISLWVY